METNFGLSLKAMSIMQTQDAYSQVCQSGHHEGGAAMCKAARQLERLAVEAVAACEAAEAEQVWLLAFEKLAALGSSSKKLTQALLRQLTGMRQGPTRVCLHSPSPPYLSIQSSVITLQTFVFCYASAVVTACHHHFAEGRETMLMLDECL